jgi:hypothetical protein
MSVATSCAGASVRLIASPFATSRDDNRADHVAREDERRGSREEPGDQERAADDFDDADRDDEYLGSGQSIAPERGKLGTVADEFAHAERDKDTAREQPQDEQCPVLAHRSWDTPGKNI